MRVSIKSLKVLIIISALCSWMAAADTIPIEEVWSPEGEFSSDEYAKVAVVQWAPPAAAQVGITVAQADRYKLGNMRLAEQFIREAAANGATYIVFPEFAVVGYPDIPELPPEEDNFRNREDIQPYVETIPGKTTAFFSPIAKELGVYIQVGLAEVDPVTDNYHNSIAVLGPNGKLVASYRKQHLFEIEHEYLVEGEDNVVFETPFGRVGLIVCSDVYDHHVMAKYRRQGVDVISLSTSWARENSGWGNFTYAARKYSAYLFAANHNYFPDSGVINPDGSDQSHIRQSDGVAYGYVPLK